jgi:hypothetical protein
MEDIRFSVHGSQIMHPCAAAVDTNRIKPARETGSRPSQKERIAEALGSGRHIPRVNEQSLAKYYRYLAKHLGLPFPAYFPKPTTPEEEDALRCTVLEMLDPSRYLGDTLDGLFCRTQNGPFTANIPVIELYVPENSFRFQLIEDYWYWFWNWR